VRPSLTLDEHDSRELQMFRHAIENGGRIGRGIDTVIDRCPQSRRQRVRPFPKSQHIGRGREEQDGCTDSPNQCLSNSILSRYSCAHDELNAISGAYIPGTGRRLPGVLINSNQPSDRQRSARRTSSGTAFLRHDGTGTEEIVSPLGRRFESKEVEADSFASEFLMPAALLAEGGGKDPSGRPVRCAGLSPRRPLSRQLPSDGVSLSEF